MSEREPRTPRPVELKAVSVFVFLGSLLGSLLGGIIELDESVDGLKRSIALLSPAPALVIAGSDSLLGQELGLSRAWVQAFAAQSATSWEVPILGEVVRHPGIDIEARGSRRGLAMAQEGQVHLLAMSSPLSAEDRADLERHGIGLRCAAAIGFDAIVFVTDLKNRVVAITPTAVSEALRGEATHWAELSDRGEGRIRGLARKGSGTTELVLQRFAGTTDWPEGFLECASNERCLNDVAGIRGGLYWASRSWLMR